MSLRRHWAVPPSAVTPGRALVVGLVASLLVAGCGVPSDTDVQVDGPPAEAGGAGTAGAPDPPPGPDEARNEDELVEFFLQAAAIAPEDPVEVLREFIHSDIRHEWEPDKRVYVARIEQPVITRGDPDRFELTVRRVGVLGSNGVVEPRTFQPEQFTLSVGPELIPGEEVPAGSERLRLVEPPPSIILLDDDALELHFDERPIYFWDSDRGKLVPDLRWLPQAVPERQRPQMVVDWLLAGPAPWLSGTVAPVPEGVAREGNVVPSEDESRLEVRLSPPTEEADLTTLDAQLWWTLYPDLAPDTEVMLVVDDTERRLRNSYRTSNSVATATPASFVVLDGEAWPYVPDDDQAELAALPDRLNTGIERAAVTRDGRHGALVRQAAGGRSRLTVTQPGVEVETDLVAQSIGQPVWLHNPSGTGLVVADGNLWQFTTGEESVKDVDLDLAGRVTSMAAAPDGRRLALVVGGRLYLAPVTRAGEVITVSAQQPLPISTTATDLEGVGFIREEWLAVVGTANQQTRLYELTVDGALERELHSLGNPEIGSFVSHPGDPTSLDARGTILFEMGGFVWRYAYRQDPAQVLAADLLGEDAEDGVPDPRSPFFLD